MSNRYTSPPFIIGLVIAAGFLLLATVRGGRVEAPAILGDVTLTIPGPFDRPTATEVSTTDTGTVVEPARPERIAEPPPVPVPSLSGTWSGQISFVNDQTANVTIRFFVSGVYDISYDASSFDPGRWTQEGRSVAWRSSSDTEYRGTMRGNIISGTTRRPTGTFYLRRVT